MNSEREASENVRELLSELSAADAAAVRPLLLSLQAMSEGDAPAPSPALAAAFKAHQPSEVPAPRRIRHRGFVFSVALIGALAAGAGTAAAVSPEFRTGAARVFVGIVGAIPFGHPSVAHSVPSAPSTSRHAPGAPAKGNGTSHPTPGASDPTHGNGNSSPGHVKPKSTAHPVPPAAPPGKGHSSDAP